MSDPIDKRSLAIEAAEAIDPSLVTASAAEVAQAVDPSFRDRANAFVAAYQHAMETGSPRTAAELAELKALLVA